MRGTNAIPGIDLFQQWHPPVSETIPARKMSVPLPKAWSGHRLPYGYR